MKKHAITIKHLCLMISAAALIFVMSVTATLAWFSLWRDIAAYAPISTPDALYIGAGHFDIENGDFEDIRYLYFDAMEGTDETGGEYWDRVFCIYGRMVPTYNIQLAFTTNNQFTYELYSANEYILHDNKYYLTSDTTFSHGETELTNPVSHSVHYGSEETYYYTIVDANEDDDLDSDDAIAGTYLNAVDSNSNDTPDFLESSAEVLANNARHNETYGSYVEGTGYVDPYGNVNKYAEPLYWHTSVAETGNAKGNFVNYYILRIHSKKKGVNDRETDIICIAAKTGS